MSSSPWLPQCGEWNDAARRTVERAHEEFVGGNVHDPSVEQVRRVVAESWRRSVQNRVGVEALPSLRLTAEELDELRRRHPLAGVIGMIRELLLPGSADDSGVVIGVGDASGQLLWVEGDLGVRRRVGDMGFVAGANWSEDAVGTAAPGMALALGQSVQVRGSERFNRLVQPWSCTAAPVRDPQTRSILGVIDVTGGEAAATPQAQMLVDATARAVEGELLLARLRAQAEPRPVEEGAPGNGRRRAARPLPARPPAPVLSVLGRDTGALGGGHHGAEATDLSGRHAELLLMLKVHRQGVSAGRLAELVYGDGEATVTVRAEVTRLRKVLAERRPDLQVLSRPYRLDGDLDTDAHRLLGLLDRGAHRVALAAYAGDVLPGSVAPGVEDFRDAVRTALRESILAEAGIDALLLYAETDAGAQDEEILRLALRLLPERSPKRSGLVSRLERLAVPD